jgi:hypothetical protein
MTTDEPGAGTVFDEVDRPATRPRQRFMSGFLMGLALQAGAAVLFAVLFVVGPKDCYTGLTVGAALLIAIVADLLAGVNTFWRASRSNRHHRGAMAAGLALTYVAALVAFGLYLAWAFSPSPPFGCAD